MSNSFELNKDSENRFLNYNGSMVFKSNNKVLKMTYDKLLNIFDEDKNGKLNSSEIKNIWQEMQNANTKNDNKLDEDELNNYIKNNQQLVNLDIKAADIISFLNTINKTIKNKNEANATQNPPIDQTKDNILSQKYSLDNIKQKYSSKEFKIKQSTWYSGRKELNNYRVTNQDGQTVLDVFIDKATGLIVNYTERDTNNPDIEVYASYDNGVLEGKSQKNLKTQVEKDYNYKDGKLHYCTETDENGWEQQFYNEKGIITNSKKNKNGIIEETKYQNGKFFSHYTNNVVDKCPIAERINADICAKNFLIIPTTGKNFEKHIKEITPQNVIAIIGNYKTLYGKSLLEDINGEWGLKLDSELKKRVLDHLHKCIINSDYWKENKPNTKLDGGIHQTAPNCNFMAPLIAIGSKQKGLEILNKCITENKDSTYNVKFRGADDSYTVTPLEIVSDEFRSADFDVRTLEIASDKHFLFGNKNGGNPAVTVDLFLGSGWVLNTLRMFNPINDSKEKLTKLIKDPNTFVWTCTNWMTVIGLDEDAEYADYIIDQHGYAVVDIDDKYVYLKDPAGVNKFGKDADKYNFKMPIKDFQKYMTNIEYATIE